MTTLEEYQTAALQVPLSLRNDLDRIKLPATGLQEESGRIGSLLAAASQSGRFTLAPNQASELRDRLADVLWYVVRLCAEARMPLQDIAVHSIAQLQARARELDPDQR
ncbi:MAG TPA: hypothetical protein VFV34_15400 [Blastocatellia bacterium]|nr:hypothetical protein [Blastocatellia bacterium]